jgi:hypothetical protein
MPTKVKNATAGISLNRSLRLVTYQARQAVERAAERFKDPAAPTDSRRTVLEELAAALSLLDWSTPGWEEHVKANPNPDIRGLSRLVFKALEEMGDGN